MVYCQIPQRLDDDQDLRTIDYCYQKKPDGQEFKSPHGRMKDDKGYYCNECGWFLGETEQDITSRNYDDGELICHNCNSKDVVQIE